MLKYGVGLSELVDVQDIYKFSANLHKFFMLAGSINLHFCDNKKNLQETAVAYTETIMTTSMLEMTQKVILMWG